MRQTPVLLLSPLFPRAGRPGGRHARNAVKMQGDNFRTLCTRRGAPWPQKPRERRRRPRLESGNCPPRFSPVWRAGCAIPARTCLYPPIMWPAPTTIFVAGCAAGAAPRQPACARPRLPARGRDRRLPRPAPRIKPLELLHIKQSGRPIN